MNSMLIYLFKTTVCLAFFYGLYMLLLRKETFFGFNRIYLIVSLFASFIIPAIRLEMFSGTGGEIPVMIINLAPDYIPVISAQSEGVVPGTGFSWNSLLLILYFMVSFLIATRLLLQYTRFRKTGNMGNSIDNEGIKVVFINGACGPFSLFRTIYIDSASREVCGLEDIIRHERAHIQHLHFIDLIIIELTIALFWLNPFVWLYSKVLRENHEYQADRSVLINMHNSKQYIALLINQVTGAEVLRLANTFSKSLTKKRMIMMTKKVSKNSSVLKALLAIPLLVLMLMAFTKGPPVKGQSDKPIHVKGTVIDKEDSGPLPGAAILIKGTTHGTTSDMDGTFELEVNQPDAILVISFVGYETQVLAVKQVMEIEMKRKTIMLDDPPDAREAVSESREPLLEPQEPQEPENDMTPEGELFFIVEEMPKFQGHHFDSATVYVHEHLVFPEEAKAKGLEGKVNVQFIVDAKGKVKDAVVIRSSNEIFNKAALKAVYLMPDWMPGKQRGKSVTVQFVMPVEFKLN